MKTRLKISQLCYLLIGVGYTILGILYTFASSVKSYHLDAMETTWNQIALGQQVVMMAIMRGSGSGFIAAGFAILILLFIPFKKGENWARWSIFFISMIEGLPTIYSAMQVKQYTPGDPPLFLAVSAVIAALLGVILSYGHQQSGAED